jgi:hypothetical protein
MKGWRYAVVAMAAALPACGGGSTAPVTPSTPTPTPTPIAAPTPTPTPTPCNDGACGNTNEVVRVRFRLYLVLDASGNPVSPTPDPVRGVVGEPLPVGHRVRFDVVGEDSRGRETNGRKNITWVVGEGEGSIQDLGIREEGFQRDYRLVAPGRFSVYVVFDGVASNAIVITVAP